MYAVLLVSGVFCFGFK